jgi:hypothetical protein
VHSGLGYFSVLTTVLTDLTMTNAGDFPQRRRFSLPTSVVSILPLAANGDWIWQ